MIMILDSSKQEKAAKLLGASETIGRPLKFEKLVEAIDRVHVKKLMANS